jgi:hypothetical protein
VKFNKAQFQFAAALVGLLCLPLAQAQDDSSKQSGSGAAITYKPPLRGAPTLRVGGASRGVSTVNLPNIAVLAPDHTGLTLTDQPTVYGYISALPSQGHVEFSIIEEQGDKPIFEKVLDAQKSVGIVAIPLSETAVKLKPDTDYLWYLALIIDPSNRSLDVVAGGAIQMTSAQALARPDLKAMNAAQKAPLLAQGGYWYDALDTLERARAQPGADQSIQQMYLSLLKQAGLGDVSKAIVGGKQ